METWELIGFAIAATLLLGAMLSGTRPRRASPAPRPETRPLHRWRRFAVCHRRFESTSLDAATCVIEEELAPPPADSDETSEDGRPKAPRPWRLSCERGNALDLPLVLVDSKSETRFRIERTFLSGTTLLLRQEKAPWLRLTLDPDGEFPALRGLRRAPSSLPRVGDLELTGSLLDREYELHLEDRLVASVSWQRDEVGSRSEDGIYVAEIVRSAPVVPLLVLIAALEVAAVLSTPEAVEADAEITEADTTRASEDTRPSPNTGPGTPRVVDEEVTLAPRKTG